MGTDQPWTRDQFHRLCQRLECAPEELAALFCLPEARLRLWLAADKIPAYWALHLVLLDQAFWRAKYGATAVGPVPVHEVFR